MVDPRTIVGILGNVISFGLFLSPTPTIYNIIKNKSVGEFSVIPYVCTVLNCLMWLLYGLPEVNPDHLLVITINGIGLALELIYVAIFFYYSTGWCRTRKIITWGLIVEAIFTLIVAMITFFVFDTTAHRTIFVGAWCVVFNIAMYCSPLTVMRQVIETKSVEYMPFTLSLTNFLNGACWTSYACIHHIDLWMLIPNGLGTLAGVVQLVLYAFYYKKDDKPKGKIAGEVELKVQSIV